MSVVASGIHWVSGSVLESGRQHKDINKGRPNTKRKKQIIYYRKLSHNFKKITVILILFVDHEKINYNA